LAVDSGRAVGVGGGIQVGGERRRRGVKRPLHGVHDAHEAPLRARDPSLEEQQLPLRINLATSKEK
jgi:hypothetical protein